MPHYIIVSNIYGVILLLPYFLFLKNRTNHQWSRFYLLSVAMLALLLPFIRLSIPLSQQRMSVESGQPANLIPETIVTAYHSIGTLHYNIITGLYITGVCLFSAVFLFKLIRLILFLRKQKYNSIQGLKVAMNTQSGPASFGKYILFPSSEMNRTIFRHEAAHYTLKHHWDKIFLELVQVCCFFWLPLYLLKNELIVVQEFQADAVAREHKDDYINLLLCSGFSLPYFNLLNNFFAHPLKRRIMMLQTEKKRNYVRRTALIIFTTLLIGGVVLLQSIQSVSAQSRQASDNRTYRTVEQMPKFPGGMPALQQYLKSNIRYPDSAINNNVQGMVLLEFVISKTGDIENVSVLRHLSPETDSEAVRIVSAMPRWEPGLQDGKKVNVYYKIPIIFRIPEDNKGQ